MQVDLFTTHFKENNAESEATLTINKTSFEGQNLQLYNLLMKGERLSFSDAFITHNITDIRRRSKDLVDIHGIKISKKFIEGTRNKEWFMTEEDKNYNLNRK